MIQKNMNPQNADYKAYLDGFMSKAEYDSRSKDSKITAAVIGVGVNVIALINPALGIAVALGSVLACALEDYVVSPKRLQEKTDIVIEDLEEIVSEGKIDEYQYWARLKGERILTISREQFEALFELKNEFPNLDYSLRREQKHGISQKNSRDN